jgi:hypothetical protein
VVTSRPVPVVAGSLRNNVRISGCSVVPSVVPMGDTSPITSNPTAQELRGPSQKVRTCWTKRRPDRHLTPLGEGRCGVWCNERHSQVCHMTVGNLLQG